RRDHGPPAAGADERRDRRGGRRAPGEDPDEQGGRRDRRGHQSVGRRRPGRVVPGSLDVLRRGGTVGGACHRLRAERGTDRPRLAPSTGGNGPAQLVARPHVRGRGTDDTGGGGGGLTDSGSAGRHSTEETMSEDTRSPLSIDITRRRFLAGSAMAGVAAFIAACTSGGSSSAPPSGSAAPGGSASPGGSSGAAASQTPTGPLHFANWDAYIDLTEVSDGEYDLPSATLDDFTAKYGVDVDYQNAKIDGNESFMATILPQLQAGAHNGLGLHVPTHCVG